MTNFKTLFLMGAFLMTVTLAGCSNTFEGAGKDIENAGEWVQDTF